MTEDKKPPTGSETIKWYYQQVKDGCKVWQDLLNQHKEHLAAVQETHMTLLISALEDVTEIAERHLEECKEQVAKYKADLPDMIIEWEDYWEKPFPYPDIKADVESWAIEEEEEAEEEESEES